MSVVTSAIVIIVYYVQMKQNLVHVYGQCQIVNILAMEAIQALIIGIQEYPFVEL